MFFVVDVTDYLRFATGSHLVSIHSMDEVEDLKKLIKPDIRSVYIGLMKNKKGIHELFYIRLRL